VPDLELREPSQRVSPRARSMWRVGAAFEGAITLGVLLVVAYVWEPFHVPWWVTVLVALVMVAYVVVVPAWKYAVHRWEVTDTAVYTQTGWWTRERRIAPLSRIQTVDYSEGALQRLFGLASVTVTTASAAGALEIAALDRQLARQLSEDLTVKADSVPGDAT
jgi:membrane protein YdbS with pleckstrin-like domain